MRKKMLCRARRWLSLLASRCSVLPAPGPCWSLGFRPSSFVGGPTKKSKDGVHPCLEKALCILGFHTKQY